MSTKVKICGLKREIDIEYINQYKPDFIGFVFFPPSSRFVTVETAVKLSKLVSPGITKVGVFLDNTIEEILEVIQSGAVDMIQIHGEDAPELVARVKAGIGIPVIEAFSIETEDDVEAANNSIADYVLLDHGRGGGGVSFDWSLLKGIEREYFLAGGLNIDNIEEALACCSPMAVDVSSGVETDKLKDPDKIKAFIEKAKRQN